MNDTPSTFGRTPEDSSLFVPVRDDRLGVEAAGAVPIEQHPDIDELKKQYGELPTKSGHDRVSENR